MPAMTRFAPIAPAPLIPGKRSPSPHASSPSQRLADPQRQALEGRAQYAARAIGSHDAAKLYRSLI